jgi:hypothetical protein
MCFIRQFPCRKWPIQLASLLFITHRIFLSSLTLCNTSFHTLIQLIFSNAKPRPLYTRKRDPMWKISPPPGFYLRTINPRRVATPTSYPGPIAQAVWSLTVHTLSFLHTSLTLKINIQLLIKPHVTYLRISDGLPLLVLTCHVAIQSNSRQLAS